MDSAMNRATFFAPGCKLQQQDPSLVILLYQYLQKVYGTITLYRPCCITPFTHTKEILFITVCPACLLSYKQDYPVMTVQFIWEIVEEYDPYLPFPNIDQTKERTNRILTTYPTKSG